MKGYFFLIQLLAFSLCTSAQNAPLANVTIESPSLICSNGGCTELVANVPALRSTSSYAVSSISYNPSFPFTGGAIIPPTGDDYWGTAFSLPFSFNFFENCYNTILVGTNGVVTFDVVNNAVFGFCPWSFSQTIPNTTFPIRNAIYGVYQDTNIQAPPVNNPAVQNVNYYVLDTGVNVAPNRVFVINFNELPQFQCNSSVGLQSSQIVLHETTNIIDINIKNRSECSVWNGGFGLVGIQNQDGTIAYTPPGRNSGTWSTSNEAWRISPNGNELPAVFQWYDNDVAILGALNNSYTACPSSNDSYKVKASFLTCGSTATILESNTVNELIVPNPGLIEPQDFFYCTQATFVYVADMSPNTNIILAGTLNPSDFTVTYYENYTDAVNGTLNNIVDISAYPFTENKTIYVAIQENVQTGCRYIKSFQLLVVPPTAPPTGDSLQNFTAGQTIADLVIIGENISWYDADIGGNMLAPSTLLEDNTTYYATETRNGCESRNINSNRFAVTVHLVLNAVDFSDSSFHVFPNPANESLSISCQNVIQSIQISNAIGQEIFAVNPNEKETKLMISQWPNGLYFLRINAANGIKTIKIVKE
jgi:hypothetical protein